MGIDGTGSNITPRVGPREVPESERPERAVQGPGQISRAERADRVEISSRGRELARTDEAVESLPPERRAEIAARLESGFYDSSDIAEQLARVLMDRGEI